MIDATSYRIFKTGSVTFFTSSLFFPSTVRGDVFNLYAFVRIFDDFVDIIPQQSSAFASYKKEYYRALSGDGRSEYSFITNFITLQRTYEFEQQWIDAFFNAMEADLVGTRYETLEDTLQYMYGSAEVIGLMMARVMRLPQEAYRYARILGRAFQYMNFLRDINEDNALGRTYIPAVILRQYGLSDLSKTTAIAHPEQFTKLIYAEITRYRNWSIEARRGFYLIPKRYRVPIAAAADMFDTVISQIDHNPLLVFDKKLVPSRAHILFSVIKQAIN